MDDLAVPPINDVNHFLTGKSQLTVSRPNKHQTIKDYSTSLDFSTS